MDLIFTVIMIIHIVVSLVRQSVGSVVAFDTLLIIIEANACIWTVSPFLHSFLLHAIDLCV